MAKRTWIPVLSNVVRGLWTTQSTLNLNNYKKKKKNSFFGIIYTIYNFFWEQLEK